MKLAEALLLRSDLQKRIESIQARIVKNTVVQEGEEPAENPQRLLDQASSAVDRLEHLIVAINTANLMGKTAHGRSLTQALAKRDVLLSKHSIIKSAAESAIKPAAYGTREIRWISTVRVDELQQQADELAEQIRNLNAEIQEANWQIEIQDSAD
jgi:hypothetical protein